MRRLAMLAILLAGCADGDAGPKNAIGRIIGAIDRHQPDDEARMFVSPEQVSDLIACAHPESPRAPWLTADDRRTWIADALERAGEVEGVHPTSLEPVDRGQWHVWHAGDEIDGGCRARVDLSSQAWLLMLDVEQGGGHTYPGVGVEVWHWGDEWRLWTDPMD
jgi:hypothetical protein